MNENEPKIKTVEYPRELIERIKNEFPKNPEIFEEYEEGLSDGLSQMLHKLAEYKKEPYDIVRAFRSEKQDELLQEAEKSLRVRRLADEAFAIELKKFDD
ncbi:MAG: hypothetical protein WC878_03935 [Candidatus Paceibacterota bacterium]|jgi:hypothetical protein